MLQNRIVVPETLRQVILRHLHAGHNGINGMTQRARQEVYWPNYTVDIIRVREQCYTCIENAPSNPRMMPLQEPDLPVYPFQVTCMDFFTMGSKSYLAVADKYSGWLSIMNFASDTAENLIKAMREYFSVFGVSETVCTDGAKIFVSSAVQQFFRNWGIKHRVSSAYNPTSNKRAEVAVKSAKRLVRDNLGRNGSLNSDKIVRALLAHRNTPDCVTGLSPSMIVFGKKLRDHIPRRSYTPYASWSEMSRKREDSFLKRYYLKAENLSC